MSENKGKISSFCGAGNCVEVTRENGFVTVTKRGGGYLFSRAEWEAFIAGVKAGEFDWDQL